MKVIFDEYGMSVFYVVFTLAYVGILTFFFNAIVGGVM